MRCGNQKLMCGITGFLSGRPAPSREMLALAGRMATALAHRGPDDSGEWADADAGVAFGFRRLAIIDLSQAGHQPMTSHSGRFTIVFNGEVYNFEEVRRQLLAVSPEIRFRGHSDTEVILAAFDKWGLEGALERFIGMYAFAVWDREERALHLVRDRLGVKPLHYGWCDGTLLFGSELKALVQHPSFRSDISPQSVAMLLRAGYVPAPHTIYRHIFKVPPGSIATFKRSGETNVRAYWSVADLVAAGQGSPFKGTAAEATDRLDALLRDAVRLRLIADVPVGIFLSGGIDSSTVAAVAQSVSRTPIKTFTIGFRSAEFDEAPFAREVAQHLGTEHHETYVSAEDALAVIPQLPAIYDEPFADASQIPTRVVSGVARRQVTVCLSGDGGDEVFGGYNRYLAAPAIWRSLAWMPRRGRSAIGRILGRLRPPAAARLGRRLAQLQMTDKLRKVSRALTAPDEMAFYWQLATHDTEAFLDSGLRAAHPTPGPSDALQEGSFVERMMYLDTITYLPDDVLAKVDRASMSVSLEAREPLLDHRLIEFAWSLPVDMRVRKGEGKWLLRQVVKRYLPAHLLARPKSGFTVPLGDWLRGPLRAWAEALLEERALREESVFRPEAITEAWRAHLSGRENRQYDLWPVLMFRAWREHNRTAQHAPVAAAGSASKH